MWGRKKGRDQKELHFFLEGAWVGTGDALCREGKLGGGMVGEERNPDTVHASSLLDTHKWNSHMGRCMKLRRGASTGD